MLHIFPATWPVDSVAMSSAAQKPHHPHPPGGKNPGNGADGPVCRICYTEDSVSRGKPVVVCNCKASFAFVHPKCLTDWIRATDATKCDICQFPFIMRKRPESLWNWCHQPDKAEEYKMTIQTAGLYFFYTLLSAFVFYATYGQCLLIRLPLLSLTSSNSTFWGIKIGTVILILSFLLAGCTMFWIVFLTGSAIVYVTREIRSFRSWRSTHFRIDISPNPNPDGEVAAPAYNLARACGLSKRQIQVPASAGGAVTAVAPSPTTSHPPVPSSPSGLKSHHPHHHRSPPPSPPARPELHAHAPL